MMTAFMYHAMLEVDDNGEYLKSLEFYSLSQVNAYRNSVKILYRERRAPMDADLEGKQQAEYDRSENIAFSELMKACRAV